MTDYSVVYLPGDIIKQHIKDDTNNKDRVNDPFLDSNRLNPLINNTVTSSIAAIKTLLPIDPYNEQQIGCTRIYFPRLGDIVVGIVTYVHSEGYRLDINSAFEAYLPATAFNNATKQNRPRLVLGSIIVARVSWTGIEERQTNNSFCLSSMKSNKDIFHIPEDSVQLDTSCIHSTDLNDVCELSCITEDDSRGWSSKETYFGELERQKGYFFDVPIALALSFQGDDCYILDRLGQMAVFEICVGANGRIWVRGDTSVTTILITQVIQQCSGLDLPQMELMLLSLTKRFEAFRREKDD